QEAPEPAGPRATGTTTRPEPPTPGGEEAPDRRAEAPAEDGTRPGGQAPEARGATPARPGEGTAGDDSGATATRPRRV
ncbi:hypothetical protein KQH19_04400, partial [Streptomyces sp. CHA3]|nr:hypothetical protein [Streptomyces sp. CHA3]